MATVTDIIEGARVSSNENGITAVRVFRVSGLTGTASSRLYNALSETNIPSYGEVHPDISDIFVTNLDVQPEEEQNEVVTVTATYSRPTPEQQEPGNTSNEGVIRVGTTVQQGETQKDKDGNAITVSLTDNPTQNATVDRQFPQTVISFERREATSPQSDATTYVGKVNDSTFEGYSARTLLCTGIEGVSNDNGVSFTVSYNFQYNPDTWDAEVVYIDPETDRPHDDVDLGTSDGVTTAKIYPETDFSPLNLAW